LDEPAAQLLGCYFFCSIFPNSASFARFAFAPCSNATRLPSRSPFCRSNCATDSLGDYADLSRRGVQFEGEPKVMRYGTGVMLHDLYGNKIYLNQDPV
jgi:hypothetical protein